MGILCSESKENLERRCAELGIRVEHSGGKTKKDEYIRLIQKHYIDSMFNGKLSRNMSFMLSMNSPMLCKKFSELKENDRKAVLEGNDWFSEEKIDGVRGLLCCMDGKVSLYSRDISKENFLPIDHAEMFGVSEWEWEWEDFVLDTEVVCLEKKQRRDSESRIGDTKRSGLLSGMMESRPSEMKSFAMENNLEIGLKVFDCIHYDGRSLFDETIEKRREKMKNIVGRICHSFPVNISYLKTNEEYGLDNRCFFKKVVMSGGEGIVLKKKGSPYKVNGTRPKDGWLKEKKGGGVLKDDFIDAFLTGIDEKTGGLEFSAFVSCGDGSPDVEAKVVAIVENPEWSENIEIVSESRRTKTIKPECYGKVAEIDGLGFSCGKIRSADIVRWRDDKSAGDCVLNVGMLS